VTTFRNVVSHHLHSHATSSQWCCEVTIISCYVNSSDSRITATALCRSIIFARWVWLANSVSIRSSVFAKLVLLFSFENRVHYIHSFTMLFFNLPDTLESTTCEIVGSILVNCGNISALGYTMFICLCDVHWPWAQTVKDKARSLLRCVTAGVDLHVDTTAHFTTRRYASAVFAVVLCPSLRPSVCQSSTSQYCIETTGRIELFLAWRLPSTYPTLCYKEIRASPKIGVLPFGTLSQTQDLENFATASWLRCHQNSSWLSSSTVELVYDTYDDRRIVDFDLLWICGTTCTFL